MRRAWFLAALIGALSASTAIAQFADGPDLTRLPDLAGFESPSLLDATDHGITLASGYGDSYSGGYGMSANSGESVESPPSVASYFVGYDAWRGHPDGGWQHAGIHVGGQYGTRLGAFSEWTGIGFQIGGSVGVYDWSGTDYRVSSQDQSEVQGFVTYGLFRHATDECPWSGALLQDWMINDNFSVFAENPTLYQWRGYLGYAWTDFTEVGIWGTWRGQADTRDVPGFGPVPWRPINQFNIFWHHKWVTCGPDTAMWIGIPEEERLNAAGSLGEYIAGASANVPLADRLALYTLVTYMHPSSSAGAAGAKEDAWDFSIGLSYQFGGSVRSRTVHGQRWAPLLPVANNGYFLVDASQTY